MAISAQPRKIDPWYRWLLVMGQMPVVIEPNQVDRCEKPQVACPTQNMPFGSKMMDVLHGGPGKTKSEIDDCVIQQRYVYPAVVRHGNIYYFYGPEPLFPLPFFDGLETDQLVVAHPFIEYLDCPWYMVGANAVDVQHFSIAHDRRMERRPEVDYPHSHAHRTVCHFEVAGNSLSDQITKHLGGAKVRLQVTDWSSTMIFARSTLAKTETFGIVCVVPLGPTRTMAHVTVMAHASKGPLRRTMFDPLRARVRRSLIRKFLRSDVHRLSGTRYSPNTLIEIDEQFSEYFDWLKGLHRRRAES